MESIKFKLETKQNDEADGEVERTLAIVITQMTVRFVNDKESTYIFPDNLQKLTNHDVLSEKAATKSAIKSLNSNLQAGHYRHVLTRDTEVFSEYFDDADNPLFKDFLLEEVVPLSDWTNKQLLNEMYKEVRKSMTDSAKFKIRDSEKLFNLKKFEGRNVKDFLSRFEAECLKNGVTDGQVKIEVLRFFVTENALIWYESCKKKMDSKDWSSWKTSLMDTFEAKSFLSDKKAFDYRYFSGSYVEYALKKENLLLDMDLNLNEMARISLIVSGLPFQMIPKFEKEKCITFSTLVKKLSVFDKTFRTDRKEKREKESGGKVEDSKSEKKKPFDKYGSKDKLFSTNPENKKKVNWTEGPEESEPKN